MCKKNNNIVHVKNKKKSNNLHLFLFLENLNYITSCKKIKQHNTCKKKKKSNVFNSKIFLFTHDFLFFKIIIVHTDLPKMFFHKVKKQLSIR